MTQGAATHASIKPMLDALPTFKALFIVTKSSDLPLHPVQGFLWQ
jgi:hypothetical protein